MLLVLLLLLRLPFLVSTANDVNLFLGVVAVVTDWLVVVVAATWSCCYWSSMLVAMPVMMR